MTTPSVQVGDKIWYVPDECHQFDTDHRGELLFAFHHAIDSRNQQVPYRQGERVTNWRAIGVDVRRWRRTKQGHILTGGGHMIEVGEPLAAWPAIVREVFADGTIALDAAHPHSGALVTVTPLWLADPGIHLPEEVVAAVKVNGGWTGKLEQIQNYPNHLVTAAIKAAPPGTKSVFITDPTGIVHEHKASGLPYCKDGSEPHTWHLLSDAKGK